MPWNELGIAPTTDERAIRRAYAGRLKLTRPEDDAAGFARLREAYEHALAWVRWQHAQGADESADEGAGETSCAPGHVTPAREAGVATALEQGGSAETVHTVWWRDQQAANEAAARLHRAAFDVDYPDEQLEADAASEGWLDVDGVTALNPLWLQRVRMRIYHLRARRCVSTIVAAFAQGESAALGALASVETEQAGAALDAHDLYRNLLVQWLLSVDPFPLFLANALLERAQWQDAQGYARPGLSAAANALCERCRQERRWQLWLRNIGDGDLPQPVRQAFAAIMRPMTRWRRWWAGHRPSTVRAVRAVLLDMQYAHPDLFARLDQENVAWWRRPFGPVAEWPSLLPLTVLVMASLVAASVFAVFSESTLRDWAGGAALGAGVLAAALIGYGGSMASPYWLEALLRRFGKGAVLGDALRAGFQPLGAVVAWTSASLIAALVFTAGSASMPIVLGAGFVGGSLLTGWALYSKARPQAYLPSQYQKAKLAGFSVLPMGFASLFLAAFAGVLLGQGLGLDQGAALAGLIGGLALAVYILMLFIYTRRAPKPQRRAPPSKPVVQGRRPANWWWIIWPGLMLLRFVLSSTGHS